MEALNGSIVREVNASQTKLNEHETDDMSKFRIKIPRNANMSISKLVEEHNKKVLVQNKKITIRKRSLYRVSSKLDVYTQYILIYVENY